MKKEFKSGMPFLKLNIPHPGAKKFYDEHGIALKDMADLHS